MSRTVGRLRVAFAAMIAGLVSLPALAAEGRIPIPFTSPLVTPISIVTPGKYILTRPIRATAGGDVINVSVGAGVGLSEVDIDLNGFTIDATAFVPQFGIRVSGAAGSTVEVTIRNGAIQGGINGITVAAPGVSVRKVVIENVRVGGTSRDAISVFDSQNTVIRNCVIIDAGSGTGGAAGILMFFAATSPPRQATIEGNLIRNTRDGINVFGGSGTFPTIAILNNRLESIAAGGSSGDGIHLEQCPGSIVMENTIRDVGAGAANGIRFVGTSSSRVFDNVILTVPANGILLDAASAGNLVLKNVVSGASGSGLFVAGARNQIEGNLLTTSGRGLTFDPGAILNVYRGNSARGNTGAAACAGVICSPDFCQAGAGALNTSQGDNFLPATAAAPPACER